MSRFNRCRINPSKLGVACCVVDVVVVVIVVSITKHQFCLSIQGSPFLVGGQPVGKITSCFGLTCKKYFCLFLMKLLGIKIADAIHSYLCLLPR